MHYSDAVVAGILLFLVMSGVTQTHAPPRTGIVVEAGSNRPVAGASVTILGVSGSTRTGQDGRFTWPVLPSPPFTIIVLWPDGRAAKPVRVEAADAAAEIRIQVAAGWSEMLTVRGVAPDIAASAGASSLSETAASLALRHPMTLAQAVENVAGASFISEGQGATPALRGLARGRTLMLVDGARVTTERGAGPNASFLDPGWLARVDVSRGPASVAYGTDAFGGVIAARTRPVDMDERIAVRASVTGGAGLPERRADLEVSHGYGGGGLLAAVRRRVFEDYTSPEGVVPHSAWEDAGARLQWSHGAGANRFSAGWQSDVAENIGRPRSDSNTIVATSPFERSHRLTMAFERSTLGQWHDLRVDAFAGASEERIEQDRLAAPGRPRRVDRTDSSARDLQVRATARRWLAGLRLHAGADVQRRFDVSATDTAFQYNAAGTLTSTVVTASIESANRTAVGVFAEASRALRPWLSLSGGVRAETIHGANHGGFFGDRASNRQAFAASGAVTVAPTPSLALTMQAARGFREPTLTDRFWRGPVGRGFLEGSPDLLPETSRQWDMAVRYGAGRVELQGAAYRYSIDNLVERYTAGVDRFGIRNRGRARITGVEIGARVDVGSGWSVDLAGHASRGRDAVDDAPLNDIAPRSLTIIARHVWRARAFSYLRVARVANHERAGPAEVPTPGHTLVDAAASWRWTSALEVQATIRNVFDVSSFSSAGPRRVLAPGRQGLVTIVVAMPGR
jgi:outer membrane receptor protein involved in Fe transport